MSTKRTALIRLGLCALIGTSLSAHSATTDLIVSASGTLAGNVGPVMELLVNGGFVGKVEVRATTATNYVFKVPGPLAGAKVDVVFINDATINGQDRNLTVASLSDGETGVLPTLAGSRYDLGVGSNAFDGLNVMAGQGKLFWGGALRLTWPAAGKPVTPAQQDAVRLLQQASFGPTTASVARVVSLGQAAWVAEQLAMPPAASYVPAVQQKYALGDLYRPGGSRYTPAWVGQRFWANAATSPDQLRKRVAFALHQIFSASQSDSNLWYQSRAYAQYLDTLNLRAFGNYRDLLQDMALSPVMGIYLSHLRNRKENPVIGLLPDENFARELMQLFSIGLIELNTDGTPRLDGTGKPIETYTNADVMALAKVFTGWSWAFPDSDLTEAKFRWANPGLTTATDQGFDLLPMKAYPGLHSSVEKPLFTGKPWAHTIPANTGAADSLRQALDTLFNHPNVGPFVSRQLIQRLVTSNPSPAYVGRVAAVFNRNTRGVRGDLGAVTRAVLLDPEARGAPPAGLGKLREPVLRVAYWMRALEVVSTSGAYMMGPELAGVGQVALSPPSVFGDFRPGYTPPNTQLADTNANSPEFQIVTESTTAGWVNLAEAMAGVGLGWTGSVRDVSSSLAPQVALVRAGNVDGLIQNLNLLLFAGRMSSGLKMDLLEAISGVSGSDEASQLNRARVAVFLALASPEYLVQR